MELHELQIRDDGPGAQGGRDPVPRRAGRVRRVRVQLPGPACCEDHGIRRDVDVLAADEETDAGDGLVVSKEVHEERVLVHRDASLTDMVSEGLLDRRPRRIASRVEDAGRGVRGLQPVDERAARVAVEGHAERDEVAHALRPPRSRAHHGRGIGEARRGDVRVLACAAGLSSAASAAAMPPWA